ncbi:MULTISPECIES: hypothetical protein [Streptomyces]|uniref:hypothetical protein n=1 Tax=Streptomyces TaxID=1883 RepID=UPI00140C6E7B|nr:MULTISPECIES: hypothetical protein [Streptomyces]MDH6224798.1 hypothetical protein [Streptomyces sp. MJP52]
MPHLMDVRPATLWPAAAAAVFTAAQLVLIPGTGLGWDEIVYVTQVEGGDTPVAFFSAPRARGISWLSAPVAAFTDPAASPAALRVHLAVLAGLGLLVALRAWRTLLPPAVLGTAGLFFAGLWVTLFYGPRAMPNVWCALGALAATGWFLRAVRRRPGAAEDRRAPWLAAAAVAFVAVMRPADGLWLALPLAAAALLVPAWRGHRAVPLLLAAGLVLGALPWVIEAYQSYGGPLARLRRAGEIQGGMGLRFAVDDQARSLVGRTLCRPCTGPWNHRWTALWWFLLPVVTAAGAVAARRAGRGAASVLAVVVAASLAVTYLFTIDYAAPRFLLPAYALLAVPVAEALVAAVRAVGRTRGRARVLLGGGLALLLLGHLAVQLAVAVTVTGRSRAQHQELTAVAAELHRLGVRPPCVVTGDQFVPVAYYAGCSSRQPAGGHDGSITVAGLLRLGRSQPLAVITVDGRRPPGYAGGWRPAELGGGHVAWLPPREPAEPERRQDARGGRTVEP